MKKKILFAIGVAIIGLWLASEMLARGGRGGGGGGGRGGGGGSRGGGGLREEAEGRAAASPAVAAVLIAVAVAAALLPCRDHLRAPRRLVGRAADAEALPVGQATVICLGRARVLATVRAVARSRIGRTLEDPAV